MQTLPSGPFIFKSVGFSSDVQPCSKSFPIASHVSHTVHFTLAYSYTSFPIRALLRTATCSQTILCL